jgi:K+-sensing histidine kinase KdpD
MTKDATGDPSPGNDDIEVIDAAERWSRILASELAGSLRHGLNQPLAAIAANANAGLRWLGRAEPDLAEARRTLERILTDVERAASLVALTRQPDGASLLRRQRCSINDLVEDAMRSVSARLARTSGAVFLNLAPQLPPLELDAAMMHQVMTTLVAHAIKPGIDGGNRQVEVRTRRVGDAVTVEFLVAGPEAGEDADRLLDPIEADDGRDGALELSASRSIVAAHGGTLSASDIRGEGTRLTMSMPTTPA